MANPTWTFGTYKNALGDTIITSLTGTPFSVDFTGVMEGKIQIENIGSTPGIGLEVSIYNTFYGLADTEPFAKFVVPTIFGSEKISISLLSGYYILALYNLGAASITVNSTTNTLSWPT